MPLVMQPPRYRTAAPLTPGQAGPATRAIAGALIVISVFASYLQRTVGMGAATLVFDRARIVSGHELWRVVTYAFCKATGPLPLLLSALVFWIVGGSFEARMGTKRFVRFFFASVVGAGLLAVPIGALCDATGLFVDTSAFGGPDAAIDAMLVSLALSAPQSSVLFGFVLPMRATTFVMVLIGLEVLSGIMTGVASMGLTLGGMASGYALTTGMYNPRVAYDRARLWRINRRRRRELYVVPPKRRRDLN